MFIIHTLQGYKVVIDILNQYVGLLNGFSFLKQKCTSVSQILLLLEPYKK